MRHSTRCALVLVAALASGLAARPAVAQIAFTDATAAAGLTHSGESYGASWGDLNGDGLLDLYASNHRTADSLWLNQGNGKFVDVGSQVQEWTDRPDADTHGGTWADFDNDGDQDLLISTGSGASELLVNENQRLIDRTQQFGLDAANRDARMPIWLDYDHDHRLDVVLTQFGGPTRLFHQLPAGVFTEATADAKLKCAHTQYGQLFDADGDGNLDFICPGNGRFPQGLPAAHIPVTADVVDSVFADFDNDGHMDIFLLGGGQLRPSSVVQGGSTRFEANLAGGAKGFEFVTGGVVTMTVDWNAGVVGGSTNLARIQIGRAGRHPAGPTFKLDPSDPSTSGMPPAPASAAALPAIQVGYEPASHQWSLRIVTSMGGHGAGGFSQAYFQVTSTAGITGLDGTGLWSTDQPAPPTLLMNRAGTFVDETAEAGLGARVQCSSVTAGDFDDDMYVDLYLACRTGASNIANILYHNDHDGTFTAVPLVGGAAGPIGLALADSAGTADSVVSGDYDADGFLDVFVTNGFNLLPLSRGGPDKLYHNNGNANHWIELDLAGAQSDRDATGARVYALANGVTQLRVQDGRYHRWSQDAKRIHFGLAGAAAVNLTVRWPSGTTQSFANIAADRLYRITEGSVSPAPVALEIAPTAPPVAQPAPPATGGGGSADNGNSSTDSASGNADSGGNGGGGAMGLWSLLAIAIFGARTRRRT